jgi:hypothetical protein
VLTGAPEFDILRAHTETQNTSHMRTKTLLLTAALSAAGALTSMAQVYSVNMVGYINLNIPKGFSMIANQLNATPDNTLGTVLATVPENTTVYKFVTSPSGHYVTSNFSVDNPGWTVPGITLNPGEGCFIAVDGGQAPSGFTATFVGEVQLVSSTPVVNGFSIVSSVIPQSSDLDSMGYPSRENDTIYRYNPAGNGGQGAFFTANFSADNPGWLPSPPTPNVGEAFFVAADNTQGGPRTWSRTFTVGP